MDILHATGSLSRARVTTGRTGAVRVYLRGNRRFGGVSERSRVRSGCLGLIVSVGVVSVAAVLAAVSLALIASFAVSALGQPSGTTSVVGLLIASVAGLCFLFVGRNIWRELRGARKRPGERRD